MPEEVGSNRVHFIVMLLAILSDDVMQKSLTDLCKYSSFQSKIVRI